MSEFPAKFKKKLPTGFEDDVSSMKDDELKAKILECESHIYSIDKSQDEDTKLNGARELVKEMSQPYKEAKGVETAKIKFLLFSLAFRGNKLMSST